jgi:hypothetical protein
LYAQQEPLLRNIFGDSKDMIHLQQIRIQRLPKNTKQNATKIMQKKTTTIKHVCFEISNHQK